MEAKRTLYEHERKVSDKRNRFKQVLHHHMILIVALYSRALIHRVRVEVLSTQKKNLENLFKQQEHPLFNVCDTVKLFKVDLQLPRYVLDTLALRPKKPALGKFNEKEKLAEIDRLLNRLNSNGNSNDVINDINVTTLEYVRSCSTQRTPRHITMKKHYLKDNGLLAAPFHKGTGICVIKSDNYAEKLNEILNLEQFVKINTTHKNANEMCLKEEKRINSVLQDLYKEVKIDEKALKELKSTGDQLRRLSQKVHKNNVPLRPALFMPGLRNTKLHKKLLIGYQ